MIDRTDAHMVLAATLWGEARGDGRPGMAAVAGCILNRVHTGWGRDVPSVCLAPWQYSCWCPDDPNLALIQAVSTRDADWITALNLAHFALAAGLGDRFEGADSYYDLRASPPPSWAARATPCLVIGHHRYMRVGRHGPAAWGGAPNISMHAPAFAAAAPPLSAAELHAREMDLLRHQS